MTLEPSRCPLYPDIFDSSQGPSNGSDHNLRKPRLHLRIGIAPTAFPLFDVSSQKPSNEETRSRHQPSFLYPVRHSGPDAGVIDYCGLVECACVIGELTWTCSVLGRLVPFVKLRLDIIRGGWSASFEVLAFHSGRLGYASGTVPSCRWRSWHADQEMPRNNDIKILAVDPPVISERFRPWIWNPTAWMAKGADGVVMYTHCPTAPSVMIE